MEKEKWHEVKIPLKKTDWISTTEYDDEYKYYVEVNIKTNEKKVLKKVRLDKLRY